MKKQEIDLESDFLSFKDQIINKFGEQYYDQAELFFERAEALAKQNLLLSAINDGRFALELSYYADDQKGTPYLLGFISQLHCDLGQISKSKAYYELGLKMIDSDAENYVDAKEMYKRLKEHIDGENWKGAIENDIND